MFGILPILTAISGLLLFICICIIIIKWFCERALTRKPYKRVLLATCLAAFLLICFSLAGAYIAENNLSTPTISYIDITEVYKVDFNRYIAKGDDGKIYDVFPSNICKGDSNHMIIHHNESKNPKLDKWVSHSEYVYTLVLQDPENIPTSEILTE